MLLGFGVWLVYLTTWSFATGWLRLAIGLFVAAVALGAVGGRRPRQARELAERLPPDASPPEELGRLLRNPIAGMFNWAAGAAALAVLALMVWKP